MHRKTNVLIRISCISTYIDSLLHVSALYWRHLQGVQYEPAELLSNAMEANWDEGCIL
jgi:hypothetical protein